MLQEQRNVDALSGDHAQPLNTFGQAGDFAVVTSTAKVSYFEKVGSSWVLTGDTGSADFQFSMFAPTTKSGGGALASGDAYVRLATAGSAFRCRLKCL